MGKKDNRENIPYDSKNFQKILEFYLFKCPVAINKRKVSQKGETFEKMNITGRKLSSLLKEMKKGTEYRCVESNQSVEKIFESAKNNSGFSDKYCNLIVYIENKEIKKTKTIFYYIRNAFAHGDFSVDNIEGQNIYTLRSSKNGNVRGAFRLKETTLIQWIDLIAKQQKANITKRKSFKKAG